jgi:FMN-dependent oxidoreductase (nitrilotriacetate monooxygenase family)
MLKLSLFINPTGHHQAAWRHPAAEPDAGINFGHYKRLAQAAERAGFDAIFLADNQCVRSGPADVVSRVAQYVANFEPLTLLGGLAAVTNHIGLIATASTSYNYPYQIARKFASLDHMSGGRVGWNIVTSGMAQEAANFGRDEHYEHDLRYEMAAEFVEVCRGLWDSWDDDAFLRNVDSGIFSDLSKLHTLDHRARFFQVKGPLNIPRPPQGYPVHVQAGQSPAGQAFAARYGEMLFVSPQSLSTAQSLYAGIKAQAVAIGRSPEDILIMPGLVPIVAETKREAEAKLAHLQNLLDPAVSLAFLSFKLGFDVNSIPLDEPLPAEIIAKLPSNLAPRNLVDEASSKTMTVRELAVHSSGSLAGHQIVGSPKHIADVMQEWLESSACDGFNIQPPYLPGSFDDFCDLVVPELRSRNLIRERYSGTTLRDHLGLSRPPSRYSF